MTKYLISFPSGAMDVTEEELPAVSDASLAVVREAKDAGVWVFGGGIDESVPPVLVDGDGTVTEGTYPQTKQLEGGYSVLELPSRGRRHLRGPLRSRSLADARRRYARSNTTPPATGCWVISSLGSQSTYSRSHGFVALDIGLDHRDDPVPVPRGRIGAPNLTSPTPAPRRTRDDGTSDAKKWSTGRRSEVCLHSLGSWA